MRPERTCTPKNQGTMLCTSAREAVVDGRPSKGGPMSMHSLLESPPVRQASKTIRIGCSSSSSSIKASRSHTRVQQPTRHPAVQSGRLQVCLSFHAQTQLSAQPRTYLKYCLHPSHASVLGCCDTGMDYGYGHQTTTATRASWDFMPVTRLLQTGHVCP